MLTREQIAQRAARELKAGDSVYLDEGLPRSLASNLPEGVRVVQGESAEAVDVAVLTASSVSRTGDFVGSLLRREAKRVVVLLEQHSTGDLSHVLAACEGAPTGRADRVITDMAVFDVTSEGLVMREVAPDISAHDVQLKTATPLLAADDLKVIQVVHV